jgi:hypothetical protein
MMDLSPSEYFQGTAITTAHSERRNCAVGIQTPQNSVIAFSSIGKYDE